jgi:two-component system, sensor histidine kinase
MNIKSTRGTSDTKISDAKISDTKIAAKLAVVIDNDALVLEATGGLLRSWGFEVVTAESFCDAINRLAPERRRPDLIVCDYRLSKGATGVDAIEGLRSAFEIPALLISGDAAAPPADDGFSGYNLLHKPVDAAKFRAALVDASVLRA